MEFVATGGDANDMVTVRVYPNGSMTPAPSSFSEKGVLKMINPIPNKLYTACIYVDHAKVNKINEGKARTMIGTVEKTPY